MCTIVMLRRPGHRWPLLMATNRDEMRDRHWLRPGRHWPEYPGVVAGLDQLGRGSWLGVNDHGVVAAVTNRTGTLGPDSEKRSRGELILNALGYPDANAAAAGLSQLESLDYRGFNLIIADPSDAYWLSNTGGESRDGILCERVPEGLSMLTDRDLNDRCSDRIGRYLPRFQKAEPPDPDARDGWNIWKALMRDRQFDPDSGPRSAMTLSDGDFATLSSSLIALPAPHRMADIAIEWLFASHASGHNGYYQVEL
ncbi:MAG: NRDE family protein [Gammaproteobacteria bacterium]|nr:NRDE family protein [Gammaproteobacteria bacterium]